MDLAKFSDHHLSNIAKLEKKKKKHAHTQTNMTNFLETFAKFWIS